MTDILLRTIVFIKHYSWIFLLTISTCFAQSPQIVELKTKLGKANLADTSRLQLLKKLSSAYSSVDPKLKFHYAGVYLGLAQKLHDYQSVADAYSAMGVSCAVRGSTDSALHYFNLSLTQSEKVNYDMGAGKSLSNIGFTYDRLDNKSEAIKYYFRGLKIFKLIKYLRGINQCYTNIGSIYFDLGQTKLALSYFSECLRSYTADKDEAGIGYALYTVADCYRVLGQYDKALESFNKSLAIRKKTNDLNGIGLTHRGLGFVYYHYKQYDTALSHLDTGITIMRQLGNKYQEAAMVLPMVDIYLAQQNYVKAEKSALNGLQITRAIKSKTGISLMLEKLVMVYKSKNNIAKAFQYQSKYVAAQDSIITDKLLKDVTFTELKRTRTENAELVKDNSLKSSQNTSNITRLNQYSNIIVLTSCILAFVIVVLLILYRRNQEKQATNKQLLLQKEEIAAINQELEVLNEEVSAQMELTHAQNLELERLNDVKNKFFSIISHDLRAPLATLQTLFTVYREDDIKEHEMTILLSKFEDTILTTGAFLDNLLEWSKSQLEGIIITPVDFNVSECINDNLRLFETNMDFKKINVSYETNYPVVVNADKNMINLVIRNLLSNSIKFCNSGDVITLNAQAKGNRTIISIKDTGPGISEANRDKLFSLEHTLSAGTHGEKGNNLGLILCRDMVLQNKGKISFETELGKGTTFWIDLPAGVTESLLKANI